MSAVMLAEGCDRDRRYPGGRLLAAFTFGGTVAPGHAAWLFTLSRCAHLNRFYKRLALARFRRQARTGHFRAIVLGSSMILDPDDEGISRELATYRLHEPEATMLIRHELKAGMTVVDVGANLGYYALLESASVGVGGSVLAIEPVRQNRELLSQNVRANRRDNVMIFQEAIGDRNSVADLYLSPKSNWHSLLPSNGSVGRVQVRVATLDDFLERHRVQRVDFIRMDLEGYEVHVLPGMERTLDQHHPTLLIELHPGAAGPVRMAEFLERLRSRGYQVARVIDRTTDEVMKAFRVREIRRRAADLSSPMPASFDDLLNDPRIAVDPRDLTVLFRALGR